MQTDMDNCIIIKPTAPTSKHFALDPHGYANTSEIAYEEPFEYEHQKDMDWSIIEDLIEKKSNKWDDSILLKWRPAKNVKNREPFILVIGQKPEDETVKGFGFGDHWIKLSMIVDELTEARSVHENNRVVVKLHPSWKSRGAVKDKIDHWIQCGVDVRTGYESIHDYLPYAKVAIVDNSTAGIECLMHQVPVISYGWPEYHWVTKKLQTLPQLHELVDDLSWHNKNQANKFIYWYINTYLCHDINSTMNRLKDLI